VVNGSEHASIENSAHVVALARIAARCRNDALPAIRSRIRERGASAKRRSASFVAQGAAQRS
jgi:hypothetical protein